MPMIPTDIDNSTVAVTSVISAVVTFGFCSAMELSPSLSLAIAAGVGIALYSFGVVPIGLLVVAGIVMIGTIARKYFGMGPPD